jgi:hypothetical protein
MRANSSTFAYWQYRPVLTARDSATWLYHGRELAGQYKILSVFSERNGQWQLCAVQACPMQQTVTG